MAAASRFAHILAVALPAVLLGGALISQYGFGLFPCEMCMWQRWPHYAALILAITGFFVGGGIRIVIVAVAALGILISGIIGGFHAGVEYGWWEGLTACTAGLQTGLDSQQTLDAILNAPVIRCDVAPWSLFGISLAGYNFLLSTGGAIAIFLMLSKR